MNHQPGLKCPGPTQGIAGLIITLLLHALASAAPAAFPPLHLKPVCDDLIHAPTNITSPHDGTGRLFICDQPGQIYIFQNGMLLPNPFLDISHLLVPINTAYTERGLLGMAFHPDFADPDAAGYRRFYLNYTAPANHPTAHPSSPQNCVTVIAEFQVSTTNPNLANPASQRILLTYGQPQANHNGGQLEFGPDGCLYIASGDGGSSDDNNVGHTGGSADQPPDNLGNSQDLTNFLGKILRIAPLGNNGPGGQYGIPADNPFIAQPGGVKEEIYAFGLRNPWRFSFDVTPQGQTRLICGDVGQSRVEEINLITSGGNYGWRRWEGTFDLFPATPNPSGIAHTPPIAAYAHPGQGPTTGLPEFGKSVTGGYLYRGSAIPALHGKYLFADYASAGGAQGKGILLGLEETSPGQFTPHPTLINLVPALPDEARIYCFGMDEQGELYVGAKTTRGVLALDANKPAGILYKIMATQDSAPVHLPAVSDNTLYETTLAGVRSNGIGPFLYAGKTGTSADYKVRRALLRFDPSSLNPISPVNRAELTLHVNLQVGDGFPMTLHRLLNSWGEGNSNAGTPGGAGTTPQTNDATWFHRLFNGTLWTTPGGDFIATPSATTLVGDQSITPETIWTSSSMVSDIELWRQDSAQNHGWILIGDETQAFTAQRFASRENSNVSQRPQLTVYYAAAPAPSPFETFLATHYPDKAIGEFIDLEADDDADGIPNLLEYAYGLNPHQPNPPADTRLTITRISPSTVAITFRRSPENHDIREVIDLTRDFMTWKRLTSTQNGQISIDDPDTTLVSELPIPGSNPPATEVTLHHNVPTTSKRHWMRLQATLNR